MLFYNGIAFCEGDFRRLDVRTEGERIVQTGECLETGTGRIFPTPRPLNWCASGIPTPAAA